MIQLRSASIRSLQRLDFIKRTIMSSVTTADHIGPQPPVRPIKKGGLKTSAALIIGDEVLGGKTKDSNSHHFAKYCFDIGIELQRVEIVPDVEEDIVESVRRLSGRYDLVITSGGIGPTHDDITYASLAKAFNLDLQYHKEVMEKMNRLGRKHENPTEAQTAARNRMALLPYDKNWPFEKSSSANTVEGYATENPARAVFASEELWVPVAIVNGNVHVFPGVPRLFTGLLEGLKSTFTTLAANEDGSSSRKTRTLVATSWPESQLAPILTEIHERCAKEGNGVKIGSYPKWGGGVVVSLVGPEALVTGKLRQEIRERIDGHDIETEES